MINLNEVNRRPQTDGRPAGPGVTAGSRESGDRGRSGRAQRTTNEPSNRAGDEPHRFGDPGLFEFAEDLADLSRRLGSTYPDCTISDLPDKAVMASSRTPCCPPATCPRPTQPH